MPHQPRSWPGTALVALAVTLLNWPHWQRIAPGLDASWQAGIAVAFTRHMQWGPAVDFTYGPYGFAGFVEPFYRSTSLIAMAYVLCVTWLLSAMLVAGLRKYLPGRGWLTLVAAGFIAWVVISLSWVVGRTADFASLAGLGLAFILVRTDGPRLRTALAIVLGALAGFTLLVKLDTGIVLIGLVVLAVAGTPHGTRRLRLAWQSSAAFLMIFIVGWAGAHQSFNNLVSFGRSSMSLAVGYSSAMGGPLPNSGIAWRALAVGALTLLAYWMVLRHRPRRERLAGWLMLVGWGWATVKEGFVSGDHYVEFFRVILLAVALACLWTRHKFIYAGALVLVAFATHSVAGGPFLHPSADLHAFGTEVAEITSSGRFSQMTMSTRERVLGGEPLTPGTVASLRRYTVAIEPWEDMVAWAAPELQWDPEPVLQSYSAYTASLDKMDAAFLTSARAPQRILYWPLSFDGRDASWDSPAAMEALYCRYRQLTTSESWQVLGRAPDRCGQAETLSTVNARFGQRVKVPRAPGKMVVATFSIAAPELSKLEGLVLKSPPTYVTVWPSRGKAVRYRFLTGTAGDEHVLALPTTLGYSARFTPEPAQQLEFSGDGLSPGHGSVTITFTAVDMAR